MVGRLRGKVRCNVAGGEEGGVDRHGGQYKEVVVP